MIYVLQRCGIMGDLFGNTPAPEELNINSRIIGLQTSSRGAILQFQKDIFCFESLIVNSDKEIMSPLRG